MSAARLFLFAARDVWFVIALPLYLASQFNWPHSAVGGFLACWVIGYGIVQALAPRITGNSKQQAPGASALLFWALPLCALPLLIAAGISYTPQTLAVLLGGLLLFSVVFAINSALHCRSIAGEFIADGVSTGSFIDVTNVRSPLFRIIQDWAYPELGLISCLLSVIAGVLIGCCR